MVKNSRSKKELDLMDWIQKHRGLMIFEAILFIILGGLAIALPVVSTLGTELFIGWLFTIGGVVQLYRTYKTNQTEGKVLSYLMGILYVIFGLYLIIYPYAGVISLTLLLTFFFILDGISKIVLGFQMRSQKNYAWIILNGFISLILAYIIWSGWPATAFWALGVLVGVNMIFFGASLLALTVNIPKDGSSNSPK